MTQYAGFLILSLLICATNSVSLNSDSSRHISNQLGEIPFRDAEPENIRVRIESWVYLEGPYSFSEEKMSTRLNELGYLPGQKPRSFFGKSAPRHHPYVDPPWHNETIKEDLEKRGFIYPEDAVDWILISVYSGDQGELEIYSTPAIVLADGSVFFIGDSHFSIPKSNESYWLGIQHRNHLPVKSPVSLPLIDNVLSFDFRKLDLVESSVAGLKVLDNGVSVMYAGNGDQNSHSLASVSIDEDDLSLWSAQNGKNSSYYQMDLDLNGDVTVRDKELLFSNYGQTIQRTR